MTDPRQLQDAARRAVAHALETEASGPARGAVIAIRELHVGAPDSAELAALVRETAPEIDRVVTNWWPSIYDLLDVAPDDDEFAAVPVMRSDLEILRSVYRGAVDAAWLDECSLPYVDEMIRACGEDHAPYARPGWVPASHWWWDWSEETPERVRAAIETNDPFDAVFRIRRLRQRVPGTEDAVARIMPAWWERARAYLLADDELDRNLFLARIARSNLERVREAYPEAAASIDTAAFDAELRDRTGSSEGGLPPYWIAMAEYGQHWWWGREP